MYACCVQMGRVMMELQTGKPPRRVGAREFRGNLTGFLRQARQGRSFLVMPHDRVLAEAGPPRQAERPPAEGPIGVEVKQPSGDPTVRHYHNTDIR